MKKTVKYKGLEITGDPNLIDKYIYGKQDHEIEVIENDFTGVIEDIYKFNSLFIPHRDEMSTEETVQWVKQFILSIMDELSELLGELSWKHWKDYSDYVMNEENIKGEIADVLIFTFGIAGILNISPEEMIEELIRKNKLNLDRQKKGY